MVTQPPASLRNSDHSEIMLMNCSAKYIRSFHQEAGLIRSSGWTRSEHTVKSMMCCAANMDIQGYLSYLTNSANMLKGMIKGLLRQIWRRCRRCVNLRVQSRNVHRSIF